MKHLSIFLGNIWTSSENARKMMKTFVQPLDGIRAAKKNLGTRKKARPHGMCNPTTVYSVDQ